MPSEQTCLRCKDSKPLTAEFWPKRASVASGFYYYCKLCVNADRNRSTDRRLVADKRSAVIRFKEDNPCADCGDKYPYYVMQFDHLPQFIKTAEVNKMISGGYSLQAVWDEIAKCELVCANCHAARSFHRLRKKDTVPD